MHNEITTVSYTHLDVYKRQAYDRINVAMPKGRKDIIKAHAEKNGESVNGFVRCV